MPSHLVIHIGPHKTGSTAIQRMLTANRAALAAAGTVFPDVGYSAWGHHALAKALSGGEEAAVAGMLAEIAALEGRVVLSSEVFSKLRPEEIARLAGGLPRVPTEIVAYQRSIIDLPPRIWQEAIKAGSAEPFPEHLARMLLWSERHHLLNPCRTLEDWAAAFGRDAIRVARYGAVGDVTRHFTERFLPPGLELKQRPGRDNAGLDPVEAEAIRRANARGGPGLKLFSEGGAGRDLLERLRAVAEDYERVLELTYVQTPFRQLEARLAGDWAGALDRAPDEPLFRPRQRRHRHLSLDVWADHPALAAELDRLCGAG